MTGRKLPRQNCASMQWLSSPWVDRHRERVGFGLQVFPVDTAPLPGWLPAPERTPWRCRTLPDRDWSLGSVYARSRGPRTRLGPPRPVGGAARWPSGAADGEGVAVSELAVLEAAAEPADPLLRGPVRPALRAYGALGRARDAVVADGRGRVQALLYVNRLQLVLLIGRVGPDAGQASAASSTRIERSLARAGFRRCSALTSDSTPRRFSTWCPNSCAIT